MLVEPVEVVLLGLPVVGPDRLLLAGEDHPLVVVVGPVVAPDVPVVLRALGVPGLLKPRVLVRGVVHHEVDDHAEPLLLGGVDELDEVAE